MWDTTSKSAKIACRPARLSGHTHNGQIFPGNLLIGLFWENPYGVQEVDGMTSVVPSGVGVWGPNMRVGTNSEVVLLTVQFQET